MNFNDKIEINMHDLKIKDADEETSFQKEYLNFRNQTKSFSDSKVKILLSITLSIQIISSFKKSKLI